MEHSGVSSGRLDLWPGRAVYSGLGYATICHHHLASEFGVGLGEPLTVAPDAEEGALQAGFLVSPNVPHAVGAAGVRGVFMWSASQAVQQQLTPGLHRLEAEPARDLAKEVLVALEGLRAQDVDRLLLQAAGKTVQTSPAPDRRVQAALDALSDPGLLYAERPFAHLAERARLSSSRLRHLVHTQTGVSLQRHLLWRRLMFALRESGEGGSLTEAAHAAGFADSAHLSRVFRATFGLAPSQVFGSRSVQVVIRLE